MDAQTTGGLSAPLLHIKLTSSLFFPHYNLIIHIMAGILWAGGILYFYMGKMFVRQQHGLHVRAHTAVKIWFNNASLLPALL